MVPSNLSKPGPRNTWTTLLTTEIPTVPNMPEPKKLISKVLKTSVKIPWNSNMVALVLLLQNHIVKALIMLVFLYFVAVTKMAGQKLQFLTIIFRLTMLLSGMKISKTGDKLLWLINSASDQQLLKKNNSTSDVRFQIKMDLWQNDGKQTAN